MKVIHTLGQCQAQQLPLHGKGTSKCMSAEQLPPVFSWDPLDRLVSLMSIAQVTDGNTALSHLSAKRQGSSSMACSTAFPAYEQASNGTIPG